MKAVFMLAAVALVGCQSVPPRVEIQRVNVPLPVECKEPEPERPAMPTEQLAVPVDADQFTQAAIAEIERREGYEIRLRAALQNCKAPIANPRPTGHVQ